VERLVLLAEPENKIAPELLSDHIRQKGRSSRRSSANLKLAVMDLEDEMIRETLTRFRNNKSLTARTLGISRQSLIDKIKRMKVSTK